MSEGMAKYAYSTKLDIPYEQAHQKAIAALRAEGFGVLTEIDVQATMKEKLGVDFRRYAILGACNPPLAHRALEAELGLGLFLPCNVIVYEEDGGSVVAAMDPETMVQLVPNPELEAVAKEAGARLRRAVESLAEA